MSYYPRTLQYTLKRLNQYSRQKFKITPNLSQNQTINAGATLIVSLPANTIVDLDTFVWFFKGTAGNGNVFSKHIETIIKNIRVEANGQMLDDGFDNYNLLWRRLADYTLEDKKSIRGVLNNGIGFSSAASNTTACSNVDYAVWNWLGFIGTVQPRCLDTSLLGDVKLHITLAGTEVLLNDGSSALSYSITDNYFTVDCISLNDGVYYSVVNKRLSDTENPIELPYQAWTSFSPGQVSLAQTTQGTLNTGSLDLLVGTYQDSSWNDNDGNAVLNSSSFFKTGSSNVVESQFQVGTTSYPQFPMSVKDAFYGSLSALNLSQDTVGACESTLSNLTNWKQNAYTSIVRFNHPTGADERVRSGMNLRGTNTPINYRTTGTEANVIPHLFAGHTAIVKVRPYKQLEVEK